MNPVVPVSWGELFDKISILEIKSERLAAPAARENVLHELKTLREAARTVANSPDLAPLIAQLRRVNETLWKIEDDIRDKEATKDFGPAFVELARAVYHNNDERGRIKTRINALLKSSITEEKQYTRY